MKTIWFFLRPYKQRIGLLIGLCLLIGYFESMHVAVLYPILNASLELGAALRDNPFLTVLYSVIELFPFDNVLISSCIIFIVLTILIFVSRYLYINLSLRTTAKLTIDYKEKVFTKFTQSDYQFFVDSRQGDLMYKAKGAPESIAFTLDALTRSVVEIVVGLSLLALLISISWKGTLVVLLGGAIYYSFARYLGYRIAYVTGQKMRASSQEENVVINEYISGIKQILTARTSAQWTTRFHNAVLARWQAWKKNRLWTEIPPRVMELFLYLGIAIVVIAILIVYSDTFYIMIPMLGTFAYAIFRFYPRLSAISTQLMQILNHLPNLEATYEQLIDKTYMKIINGTKKFSGLQSGIVFESVSFTHHDKESATVNEISLIIKKNSMTAIVGPSGAGKSTIVNLLLRLYDVDGGAILIDGMDIRDYELSSFLDKIGFVSQETFIYNASVKDNIAFGGDYSLDEIIQSAESANAHNFVQQLPQGYDTIVGDQGVKISGGERQRIAIARAMIRKPQILVLDEATSALDNVSERVVQRAIDQVSEGCTTMVVAHRLSTIRRADIIYVMDNGKVVESGSHRELIKGKGKYSTLYSTQEDSAKSES